MVTKLLWSHVCVNIKTVKSHWTRHDVHVIPNSNELNAEKCKANMNFSSDSWHRTLNMPDPLISL